ncbi:MAG: hypothetical protein H6712_23610 [Myxococcales bacterium]|nr:hypothetical protein [Myxococcales bacterium]
MLAPGIHPVASMRSELDALVDRRFAGGDRSTALVIGSGVNLQAAIEVGASALDWERLLREIEAHEGIVWDGDPPRSMTARWEALLQRQSKQRASDREDDMVRTVVDRLEHQTEQIWAKAGGRPPPLYTDLLGKRFRDVVSLNFDDRLARAGTKARLFRATSPAETKLRRGSTFSVLPQLYQRYHLPSAEGFTRIWHPHGRSSSQSTLVLGVGRYGRLVADLDVGWGRYKSAEREFGEAPSRDAALFPAPRSRRHWTRRQIARWSEHRRAPGPWLANGRPAQRMSYRRPHEALSWLDVVLMSPLLIIGCGLGSDEFPLWWALHQRARNQARHPARTQVPVVLVTAEPRAAHELDHLRGGPGGLCTAVFPTWAELWAWVRSI